MRMSFDLQNRVNNVSLAPSPNNSLLPIFEAVSNSIHAIESRFNKRRLSSGKITIMISHLDDSRIDVKIFDNGIGLNRRNLESFRTSDSPYKFRRGGKGVGRLSWLKVFEHAKVDSVFLDDDSRKRKISFRLTLSSKSPIQEWRRSLTMEPRGSEILLAKMRPEYLEMFPKKDQTIINRLIGHFLPYLVADDCPEICVLIDGAETNLTSTAQNSIIKKVQTKINVNSKTNTPCELRLTHLLLHKSQRVSSTEYNWIFYGGNQRVVTTRCIDAQLGLKLVGPSRDQIYIGYITGEILDKAVNTERTGFSVEAIDFDELQRAARDAAKRFLKPDVDAVREQQKEKVEKLIKEHPTLRPVKENLDQFVNQKLSLNTQEDEAIYLEMHRHVLRKSREQARRVAALKSASGGLQKAPLSVLTEAADEIEQKAENALAEYVRWRKQLLDLLTERLAIDLPTGKRTSEADVHALILPLRATGSKIKIEEKNVWIVDDRLPFGKFFASDKQLRSIFEELKSRKRPDILLFDHVFGFAGQSSIDPVILVEFKKPNRNDYTRANNPVDQLVSYVQEIRTGKQNIVDIDGVATSSINSANWYHGYVIADLTQSLTDVLPYTAVKFPSPDGQGMYGLYEPLRLVIQVIPYEHLLRQARARNEVFFQKLGI